jgi:hypothetical protein
LRSKVPGTAPRQKSSVAASAGDAGGVDIPVTTAVGIAVCVVVTILFGVWPQPLFNFAHAATLLF